MARISNGIEVVCINTFAIGEFREVGWRLGGAKISNSNLGEPSDAARYNTLTEKHSHSTEIRLPSAQPTLLRFPPSSPEAGHRFTSKYGKLE
nr:uncharacterized protein LOC124218261 isoform X2 [Neodiprion pinetum]